MGARAVAIAIVIVVVGAMLLFPSAAVLPVAVARTDPAMFGRCDRGLPGLWAGSTCPGLLLFALARRDARHAIWTRPSRLLHQGKPTVGSCSLPGIIAGYFAYRAPASCPCGSSASARATNQVATMLRGGF